MTPFFELVKRNMKIYLRDRSAVFFSLLSMIIALGLMLFFLGDMSVNAISDALAALPGRDAETDQKNARLLIMLWTCAGIVAINAPTVTLAVYSNMIRDKMDGKFGSICTAPVSRLAITASYVAAAWICSVIICALTLALSEIYCIMQGGEAFSVLEHGKLLGMICVNSFTYATLMYLAAVLVKTAGAWSGIGTIIGTLVGFLGGIYIPIGSLAEEIGIVLKCTPVIYGAKMFRSIMTADISEKLFSGIPAEFKTALLEELGIRLDFFGHNVSDSACVILLTACGVIFLLLGALATAKTRQN